MKFGPVPVKRAQGTILAHSMKLPDGRLRKGIVLQADHLDRLQRAGVDTVTVARLGPDDLHEDEAAQMLAGALPGDAPHVHLTPPFTGRVNLIADRAGVVCLDAGRITAANSVDPMITIATVPPYRQMHAGGMVATVKIISYGVDGAALRRAADLAFRTITLAVPVHATASLILTEIPGGPGDKGVEAIENRVTGLEMSLSEVVRCAHDTDALAGAIGAATGDIVLILTASATSDPHDTAPQALRQAGGNVTRFGLPVDPGNLLFLGELAGRSVIGLPGSARSPVLHGADWVLSRVACGLSVSSADISAMGVGGLLKEIPTRPQPRQRRREDG